MISWVWLIPAFFGGAVIGIFMIALFSAAEDREGEKHADRR